jgi:hypothetical protein
MVYDRFGGGQSPSPRERQLVAGLDRPWLVLDERQMRFAPSAKRWKFSGSFFTIPSAIRIFHFVSATK